jgi:hypothetical protein
VLRNLHSWAGVAEKNTFHLKLCEEIFNVHITVKTVLMATSEQRPPVINSQSEG